MMKYIYLSLLICLICACAGDNQKISSDQLLGKLEIREAKRNGKITKLLSGGFFDFKNANTMLTNIKGDTISHTYALSGNKISTTGTDPMDFDIIYVSADTIILTSQIGKSKFEFLTIKD